jgi:hypothetical protein
VLLDETTNDTWDGQWRAWSAMYWNYKLTDNRSRDSWSFDQLPVLDLAARYQEIFHTPLASLADARLYVRAVYDDCFDFTAMQMPSIAENAPVTFVNNTLSYTTLDAPPAASIYDNPRYGRAYGEG